MKKLILVIVVLWWAGCSPSTSDDDGSAAGTTSGLTADQKHRAERLTSLFENDTIVIQYDSVENLGDGRGYTCGRAGFTTATGDALEVVKRYTSVKPGNALASFLTTLRNLARDGSDDVSGLGGFPSAWKMASGDPDFRAVQDQVVNDLYYQPSQDLADRQGLRLAFSRAVLYDTIIQHGDGDDSDGLPALIKRTNAAAGGSPSTGIDEVFWLRQFLSMRRADLAHAFDPATREEWAVSVGRVDVFSRILDGGNLDLAGPIEIHTADYDAIIP